MMHRPPRSETVAAGGAQVSTKPKPLIWPGFGLVISPAISGAKVPKQRKGVKKWVKKSSVKI